MKKISSKVVFSHPRLSLVEDEVLLPNGQKSTYLLHKDPRDAALIIAIRKDRKVLLQKEFNYPIGKRLYQFPGGASEKGEKPEQTAQRELTEEAGYAANKLQQIGKFYLDNRRSSALLFIFVATDLVEKSAEGDEFNLTSHWVDAEKLDVMIGTGKILNPTLLAAWAIYKASV